MSSLISFLIFILILLIYIHITAQYKKSEDLEIYEADYKSNQDIQDVCDIRQPVLFQIQRINPTFFEHKISDILQHSKGENNACIKDVNDLDSGDSINLPFRSAYGLMETDTRSRFYSENNFDMTEEIIEYHFKTMDEFLKPKFTLQTKYDVMFGSDGAYTALKYHTFYRHFICVQSGSITVKMTPWKSSKLLHIDNDYEHYEFRSRINVWNPQEKYLNEMEQLKFLEFNVSEGMMLYIPPYWFYSIKFIKKDDDLAMVGGFTYNSVMNITANLPKWGMYYLQQYNITQKTEKTLKLNNDVDDETNKCDNKQISSIDAVKMPQIIKDDNSTIISDANKPLEPTYDFTERGNEQIYS